MGSTLIASRAEAYCTNCPVGHRIVVFLVCLHIFAEFKTYVFVVVNLLSSHDASW